MVSGVVCEAEASGIQVATKGRYIKTPVRPIRWAAPTMLADRTISILLDTVHPPVGLYVLLYEGVRSNGTPLRKIVAGECLSEESVNDFRRPCKFSAVTEPGGNGVWVNIFPERVPTDGILVLQAEWYVSPRFAPKDYRYSDAAVSLAARVSAQ